MMSLVDRLNRVLPHGNWRLRSVVLAVVGVWLVLAGRLIQIQWWDRAQFAETANRQRSLIERIPARPGEIVDRRGRLLATTITTQSLFVNPSAIDDVEWTARVLSEALGLETDDLARRLSQAQDKQFLWIKRRLNDEEADRVRRLELPEAAWGFRPEYLRRYPQGGLAAHVLGLRDIDGVGRGGVEESCDAMLRGTDGLRVLIRDALGRVIAVEDETTAAPRHGRSLVLSLDAAIQHYAERELDRAVERWQPRSGCVIVLDPRNGDVLAMASRPAFDPNGVGEPNAWTNTAVGSVFEPGSTFKPFVVAWALEQRRVTTHEVFDCENGSYRMGGRVLHDHHPHGRLPLGDVLVYSSNIGMAKVGERLENGGLYDAALTFGFGRRTGLRLPGELPGIVRPLKQWNDYSTGSVPMGQEIAATPLQVVTAYAALCNGGTLISPRLVLRQSDILPARLDPGEQTDVSPDVVSRTVRPDVADWLLRGPLTDVVRRGTGKRAQLEGYMVFGKSGTAQKIDPATGRYAVDMHVCSFVCGAPAEQPRVLVLVSLDEPNSQGEHFGGTVAAPAAARILEQTLDYLRVPRRRESLRAAEAGGTPRR